jgi:hypothetical protein
MMGFGNCYFRTAEDDKTKWGWGELLAEWDTEGVFGRRMQKLLEGGLVYTRTERRQKLANDFLAEAGPYYRRSGFRRDEQDKGKQVVGDKESVIPLRHKTIDIDEEKKVSTPADKVKGQARDGIDVQPGWEGPSCGLFLLSALHLPKREGLTR